MWLFAGGLMEQLTNHGSQTYPIIYTMGFFRKFIFKVSNQVIPYMEMGGYLTLSTTTLTPVSLMNYSCYYPP